MYIKLDQYKVFYVTAKSGSFSEAAKALYITQSAISQQIRSLESELGVVLFERGRKGAKLTAQGELLFSYAKRAIEEIDNAENLFSRMKTLDAGSLRIVAGDTIIRHYLLDKIQRFHKAYPAVKIEIINRVTDESLASLTAGDSDVAFVNLPIDRNKYHAIDVINIRELHDIFIAGEEYKHLADKTLTMRELSELPLVMLESKSNTRKTTDAFFRAHGINLNPEFELGSYDLLFEFASKGLGIACVTEEFVENFEKINVFKLKTDFALPTRQLGLCTLSNVSPTPAVIKLIEMLNESQIDF